MYEEPGDFILRASIFVEVYNYVILKLLMNLYQKTKRGDETRPELVITNSGVADNQGHTN